MKYTELQAKVAEATGVTIKQAKAQLDATVEAITAALASGDAVDITGLGKITVTAKPARKGRNPATGAEMDIAASNAAGFKASSVLKGRINA